MNQRVFQLFVPYLQFNSININVPLLIVLIVSGQVHPLHRGLHGFLPMGAAEGDNRINEKRWQRLPDLASLVFGVF